MDQTSPHNGYHHIFMIKIGIWVHVKNYKRHTILIHASPFSISTSRILVPVLWWWCCYSSHGNNVPHLEAATTFSFNGRKSDAHLRLCLEDTDKWGWKMSLAMKLTGIISQPSGRFNDWIIMGFVFVDCSSTILFEEYVGHKLERRIVGVDCGLFQQLQSSQRQRG